MLTHSSADTANSGNKVLRSDETKLDVSDLFAKTLCVEDNQHCTIPLNMWWHHHAVGILFFISGQGSSSELMGIFTIKQNLQNIRTVINITL